MVQPSISELVGQVFNKVVSDEESVTFINTITGYKYSFQHYQSCCESVYVESIVGDLADLENTPILLAEESEGDLPPLGECGAESYTWTFYKFATVKGYVDIRWYGSSNGYYSESVDLIMEKL